MAASDGSSTPQSIRSTLSPRWLHATPGSVGVGPPVVVPDDEVLTVPVSPTVGVDGLTRANAPFLVSDEPQVFAEYCLRSLHSRPADEYWHMLTKYLNNYNQTIKENLEAALTSRGTS